MKLAGVVITHNEERNIERCLKSLKFCDEIIIVDADSTDKTRELCARYTPIVTTRPWRGYADQKNHAVSLACSDWVISLDADEEVSEQLRHELLNLLGSHEPPHCAFLIPRKTLHSGRWIRYGGWYPNRLVRVFKKSRGHWVGNELHERWESAGPIGILNGHILHHSFENIADQVERNNRYSTLGAESLGKSGIRFSVWKLTLKPISKFFETYLFKLGFLDGYPGFLISVSAAYSVFLKWAKLWELEKSAK